MLDHDLILQGATPYRTGRYQRDSKTRLDTEDDPLGGTCHWSISKMPVNIRPSEESNAHVATSSIGHMERN